MEEEIWKPIKDFEGYYEVSNIGRVRSLNYKRTGKGKILKNIEDYKGYLEVVLTKNGKRKQFKVHRLVAEAFIPNPENKPCIDHINTIKSDNRVENLRWVTYKENSNNEKTLEKFKGENHHFFGKHHTEETKKKISEAQKGENNHMYGKHHTEEVKEKMRKPKPDEYKQKMSEKRKGEGNPYYGKKHSKEWKEKASKRNKGSNNGNSKKVIQYTKDGEIIKIWDCAKQITEELNISYNSLMNRLNGKVKTKELNGFIWKYEKDVNKNDN